MKNFGINQFALLTAAATLGLIGAGGLVTSHGVGLSVPDWPNTYGYNMFFFPFSRWVGGIFYEHTHRLLASAVGLMTSVLALWLYGRSARPLMRGSGVGLLALAALVLGVAPKRWADAAVLASAGAALAVAGQFWPRTEASPRWLRRLGVAAFFAVVLQGVLGGLRVVWLKDQLGIFHAALAQVFFGMLCVIAWGTTKSRAAEHQARAWGGGFRLLIAATTFLILVQLVLGATMRHQHAGLAIADFPLAYGKLWPATDPASIAVYNRHRLEVADVNPITAFQVLLQMAHRIVAGLILAGVLVCAWKARKAFAGEEFRLARRLSFAWVGLVLSQVLLGVATIWSGKAADIATAHVVVGALCLGCGGLLSLAAPLRLGFAAAGFRGQGRAEPGCLSTPVKGPIGLQSVPGDSV